MIRPLSLILVAAALALFACAQKPRTVIVPNCYAPTILAPGSDLAVTCFRDDWPRHVDFAGTTARLIALTREQGIALERDLSASRRLVPESAAAIATTTFQERRGTEEAIAIFTPPTRPGLYLVRIERGSDLRKDVLADVSSIGLMSVSERNRAFVVPISLATYHRASPGSVRVFSMSPQGTRELAVDRDGVADLTPTTDATIYASSSDGSIAFINGDLERVGRAPLVSMQTDRPIYRPGDVVHLRAIIRRGGVGAYRIPTHAVSVIVRDASSRTIATRTLRPDAFGTVATDVRLAQDAPLGSYEVTVDGADSWFAVQAYRKPEYVLSIAGPTHAVLGGEPLVFAAHVRYLFGAPAGGMHLHYHSFHSAMQDVWEGPFDRVGGSGCSTHADSSEGDAVANARGDATIVIPTVHDACRQYFSVEFDARDASGRTVSDQRAVSVMPASFAIALAPRAWLGEAGRESVVDVFAHSLDDSPRAFAAIAVHIVEETFARGHERDRDAGTVHVVTGALGTGSFGFTPSHAGTYRFDAIAFDEHGYAARATQLQWVTGAGTGWLPRISGIKVLPEKRRYEPGETARVLLALPKPDSDVVVTFSSDRYLARRVLHVAGTTAMLSYTPPRGVDAIGVDVFVPTSDGTLRGNGEILMDPRQTRIALQLRPSKATYRPGDLASWSVHASDARSGAPVQAEVALGIVDRAIYAIAGDESDPHAAFYRDPDGAYADVDWYRPQPGRFLTFQKVIAARGVLVKSSVSDDLYAPATPPPASSLADVALRSHLRDTAFWSPSVVTDARGDATVRFAWPENLTTWVATGVAVDAATRIGKATADALVTKPLLVRLETPRFLRAGDRAQIVGIVHGPRAGASVAMQLDAPIIGATGMQRLTLDTNRLASGTWEAHAPGVGLAALDLRASDGANSDGLHATLPLLGANALEHERASGELSARSVVPTDLGPGELAGSLHLRFTPSPLAELAETLRAFDVYPYDCTEQTASNGIVAAALEGAALTARGVAFDPSPTAVMDKARARLRDLRRGDDTWGWWESDGVDPFMSAYALFALERMERVAPDSDASELRNTAASLDRLIATNDTDTHVRAFARYAIAGVDPTLLSANDRAEIAATIGRADAPTAALDGLAALATRDPRAAAAADTRLQALAQHHGARRFWSAGDWNDAWWSDPVVDNALVAMFYDGMQRDADRDDALATVRELSGGDWWYTTLDTALASLALAQAEPRGTRPPDATIVVRAGSAFQRTLHLTSLVPDAADGEVVIPASVMQSHPTVTIALGGTGSGIWSSDFQKYADRHAAYTRDANAGLFTRLFSAPPSLQVSRRYTVDHPGPWRVGDVVTVDLWLSAREDARYVTLEDPFPAGVEYQPLQGEDVYGWSGMQFLDDRAAFFFADVRPGITEHLTYRLRVTTPGTYRAPGPSAFASYGPPQAAIGTGEDVRIIP
ncbi:MAG: hypothetical protein KGN02_04010 [bacterium]|nr:hypothetical protein [bacterium]